MFQLDIRRPYLDYDQFLLKADLTPDQIATALSMGAVRIDESFVDDRDE